MTNSSKSSLESKTVENNPLDEIVRDMARQKEFEKDTDISTDYNVDDENIDELVEASSEAEEGTDYYDSKGKIMTVRKKRSLLGHMTEMFKRKSQNKMKKIKGVEADPEGRSYYYSTYRKKTFDPDHWKTSLSKYE